MKRLCVGAVLTGVTFAILSCAGDPTASLRNGPASLTLTPTQVFVDTGSTTPLTVRARDGQLNPVVVTVTGRTFNATIAALVRDTTRPVVDSSEYSFVVVGVVPGQTKLEFVGGGLTDTAIVNVLPVAFVGAVSDSHPKGGAPITIHSTALVKFDPAAVKVTFTANHAATVLSASADSVYLLVPYSDSGKLTISGITLPYAPGAHFTLPTKGALQQIGDRWAADSSWQTAPDITSLLPAAAGDTAQIIMTPPASNNQSICPGFVTGQTPTDTAFLVPTGPCAMFKFTLADSTKLNILSTWEGDSLHPDFNVYVCSDSTVANFGTACFEEGGAGVTGKKPEKTGVFKYPGGTHWLVVDIFSGLAAGLKENNYISIIRQ